MTETARNAPHQHPAAPHPYPAGGHPASWAPPAYGPPQGGYGPDPRRAPRQPGQHPGPQWGPPPSRPPLPGPSGGPPTPPPWPVPPGPGRPQPAGGVPEPAAPVPPTPRPARGRKRLGTVIGVVVVLAALGGLGWLARSVPSAAASAAVGDCVAQEGEDDVRIVGCAEIAAEFRVVGKLEDRTMIDAGLFACSDFADATSSFWQGEQGRPGLVLCLAPVSP